MLVTARFILTLACVVLVHTWALAAGADDEKFETRLLLPCGTQIVRFHGYDANHGQDELTQLEALNEELEGLLKRGELTLETWVERSLAIPKDGNTLFEKILKDHPTIDPVRIEKARPQVKANSITVVRRSRNPENLDEFQDTIELHPYQQINLPMAKTGIYLHTNSIGKQWKDQGYQATILALPGIGFFGSRASSLIVPSNTLAKGSNPGLPVLPDPPNKRLKALMVPIDSSLNGMQTGAPVSFVSPRGVVAVQRHADLYIRTRFPNLPRFALGRSQGGLNVLEYATRYPDVGVIAMNPSFPADDVIHYSIDRYENGAKGLSSMKDVNPIAWEAHHMFTSAFEALRTATPSVGPSMVILGEGDPSYPPYYPDRVRQWIDSQPGERQVVHIEIVPDEARRYPSVRHTLLVYEAKAAFERTLGQIGRFIIENSSELSRRQAQWLENR